MTPPTYRTQPWPVLRNVVVDFLNLNRPHWVLGGMEVDVTRTLRRIGEARRASRQAISLNTCILHCLAVAVHEYPIMQAYRSGNRLLFPERVDIGTFIEKRLPDGGHTLVGHVVRGAEAKGIAAIHRDLRAAIRAEGFSDEAAARQRRAIAHLPAWLRRLVWGWVNRTPLPFWESRGTVGLTNPLVPGFHRPFHFSVPTPYTCCFQVGSTYPRLELAPDGSVREKTCLWLNAAVDHDIVDGATVLRFSRRLAELLESGAGLEDAGLGMEKEAS